MRSDELKRAINRLRTAQEGANWQGKFTEEIREATKEHRLKEIAKPVDEVLRLLLRDLAERESKTRPKPKHRHGRLPYADDGDS